VDDDLRLNTLKSRSCHAE